MGFGIWTLTLRSPPPPPPPRPPLRESGLTLAQMRAQGLVKAVGVHDNGGHRSHERFGPKKGFSEGHRALCSRSNLLGDGFLLDMGTNRKARYETRPNNETRRRETFESETGRDSNSLSFFVIVGFPQSKTHCNRSEQRFPACREFVSSIFMCPKKLRLLKPL